MRRKLMYCVECGKSETVDITGMSRLAIEAMAATYHCPAHRKVTDEDLTELQWGGLQ